ncbi:hypothetical protein [Actinomycetospora chiangmaiensis]|uniref:hypothetical protein n=1 Tax=Actinomycetospora chiangmaiensis TaxID=402650 RepID=UPI00039C742C|nr:hypothetical protein [Actinomycetospora chiangmaiensis]
MTTPTDRSVTALVGTVLGGYGLLAYAAVAPGLNVVGALLGLVLALAVLGVQLGYVSRPGRQRSREGTAVALLALACLLYVPVVAVGVAWIGFAGFLAGSLVILLPPRAGLAGLAVVVVSVGVIVAVAGAPPLAVITSAIGTLVTGLVVSGLTRLWAITTVPVPVVTVEPPVADALEDAPSTDAPSTDAPSTDAPGTDASERDAPAGDGPGEDDASPEEAAPTGDAASEEGDGTPESGTPESGTPESGSPEPGSPEPGSPEPGSPEPEAPEVAPEPVREPVPGEPAAEDPVADPPDRSALAVGLGSARAELDAAGVELSVLGEDVVLPEEVGTLFAALLRVAVGHAARHAEATTCHVTIVRRGAEARIVVTHDGATDDPDPDDFEALGERFDDRDGSVLAERDDAEFTVDGRLPVPGGSAP